MTENPRPVMPENCCKRDTSDMNGKQQGKDSKPFCFGSGCIRAVGKAATLDSTYETTATPLKQNLSEITVCTFSVDSIADHFVTLFRNGLSPPIPASRQIFLCVYLC